MNRKQKLSSYEKRKQKSYLVFLIPFLVGFFLLFLGIYANSLKFSFCDVKISGADGYALKFVGIKNYKFSLLTDPDYLANLRNSLSGMFRDVIVGT